MNKLSTSLVFLFQTSLLACSTVTIVDGDDGEETSSGSLFPGVGVGGGGANEGGATANGGSGLGGTSGSGGAWPAPTACEPGATETCNGRDDNCDGQVDEGFVRSRVVAPKLVDDFDGNTWSIVLDATPTGYRAFATVALDAFNFDCPGSDPCRTQLVTWGLTPEGEISDDLSVLMMDVGGRSAMARLDDTWALVVCERTPGNDSRLRFATVDLQGDMTLGDRAPDYDCSLDDVPFVITGTLARTEGHLLYAWGEQGRAQIVDFSPDGAFLDQRSIELMPYTDHAQLVTAGARTFLNLGVSVEGGQYFANLAELLPNGVEKSRFTFEISPEGSGIHTLVADARGTMKFLTDEHRYDVTDPASPIDEGPWSRGFLALSFRPRADTGWLSCDVGEVTAFDSAATPQWTAGNPGWQLPRSSVVDRGAQTAMVWAYNEGLHFSAVGCEVAP